MIRLLLVIFFVGLIVSAGSFAAAVSLGGPTEFVRVMDRMHVDFGDGDGPGRYDPGETSTREIAWSGAERLEISVPAEVVYTQGAETKITVTGPKNWIDRIEVSGGEITLPRSGRRWRSRGDDTIRLTIQAPSVKAFELSGAQTMTINGYNQDSLDIQVNGAAQVTATGTAKRLSLELNGAGDARLGQLVNDDARVELNGAGSVTLAPRNSVDVEINGVGNARLLTRPATVKQAIHGVGSVTFGDGATTTTTTSRRTTTTVNGVEVHGGGGGNVTVNGKAYLCDGSILINDGEAWCNGKRIAARPATAAAATVEACARNYRKDATGTWCDGRRIAGP